MSDTKRAVQIAMPLWMWDELTVLAESEGVSLVEWLRLAMVERRSRIHRERGGEGS